MRNRMTEDATWVLEYARHIMKLYPEWDGVWNRLQGNFYRDLCKLTPLQAATKFVNKKKGLSK